MSSPKNTFVKHSRPAELYGSDVPQLYNLIFTLFLTLLLYDLMRTFQYLELRKHLVKMLESVCLQILEIVIVHLVVSIILFEPHT